MTVAVPRAPLPGTPSAAAEADGGRSGNHRTSFSQNRDCQRREEGEDRAYLCPERAHVDHRRRAVQERRAYRSSRRVDPDDRT